MGDIFELTIGNENLHGTNNDNGVGIVNLPHLTDKVQCSHTPTSPDGNTHNKIDHILIGRWQHSSVLDIQPFREAD
jgi:hypothetical protein